MNEIFEKLGIDEQLKKANPQKLKEAIIKLYNLVETVAAENTKLREDNQRLRNEIALLKGEKGKPDIRGKNKGENISSEAERKQGNKQDKKSHKKSKNQTLTITKTEVLPLDTSSLPKDVVFKGHETVIIQDIVIQQEVIEFKKEVYYSPSLHKTYVSSVPGGYEGAFGPQLKAFVLLLKSLNNTESGISQLLETFSIDISTASINRILTEKHSKQFHQEKTEIFQAGLQSSKYQHTDDTGNRVAGENWHTHVFCNPYYSAYFTTKKKDRVTILNILSGGTCSYIMSEETPKLFSLLGIRDKMQEKLLQAISKDIFYTKEELDQLLAPLHLKERNIARILEATAITAYHKQTHLPIIEILISDDAPQFKLLTGALGLCWIHDGRHYKKLHPVVPLHQRMLDDFLHQYWKFYHKLLAYKDKPTQQESQQLKILFDQLFTTKTGYVDLDERITKTRGKKENLLLVLTHPEIPLQNNPAELCARVIVRKRDVSLHSKSEAGAHVQDSLLTIVETAKKLQVNVYAYLVDRITHTFALPSLSTLILQKSAANIPCFKSLP